MTSPFPLLSFSRRFCGILSSLCLLAVGLGTFVATAQLASRFAPTPAGFNLSGTSPQVLSESDVNGDGKLDLVIAAFPSPTSTALTVSYLPGNGTGGFGSARFMATLLSNYSVLTSGDFNHDGQLDLILFQPTTGRVLPMLGTAQQGFQTGTSFLCSACGLGNTLGGQATGDFNRDTNLDLVLANTKSGTLVTLLGNGNGTFRSPIVSQGFTTAYFAIVVGDFNRDNLPDLVVSDGAQAFQTALGNGDGSFRPGSPFQTSSYFTTAMLTADLTGDGKLDLIAISDGGAAIQGCSIGSTLSVLPGNGDGTFGAEKDYPVGVVPSSAVIGDFNGDGKPDIVAVNSFSDSFSVLLNLGSGKLAPAVSYRMGLSSFYSSYIFGGDLNGDKRPDLAIVSEGGVATVIAQPGGTFHVARAAEFSFFPETIAPTVDFNHDGIPDLLALGNSGCKYDIGESFSLISSNGSPLNKLRHVNNLDYYSVLGTGIGDFNSDGNLDALVLTESFLPSNSLGVYLNDGQGNFGSAGGDEDMFPTTNATGLAVGDFNGDGKSDAALIDGGEIQIRLGTGGKNFSAPVSYSAGGHPVSLAVRDLNGDGKKDLVAVNQGNNSVTVLLGKGNGTFAAAKSYAVASGPFQVAFADFNRDGKVDLVVADLNEVSVLLGKGDGTFEVAHNYAAGTPLISLAAATLRGNGVPDVLVGAKSGDLIFFPGIGDGTLGAVQHYAAHGTNSLQVADFNGDGAQDIVVSGPRGTAMSILYNQGGTHIALATSATSITFGHGVTFTASLGASILNSGTPTGTITFRDGTKIIATVPIAGGKATFNTSSLARGSHSVSSSYNGSTSFNSHVSNAVTVTVR